MDIGLSTYDEASDISFYFGNEDFKEEFILNINANGYNIKHKSGTEIKLHIQPRQRKDAKRLFPREPAHDMVC